MTIVHSHFSWPSASPTKQPLQHSHTTTALELISHVAHWATIVSSLPDLPDIFPVTRSCYIVENFRATCLLLPFRFYLRGPPSND